jgi:uncharacterized membrane protein YeaQ/YmgE (transglycosylase-associated protein family)
MGILWTILIGLVAGLLAKFIMPGKDPGGIVITILLGIGGALVANFLGTAVGWYQGGRGAGLIGSTLGAIVILWIYRMIKARKGASA